MVQQRQRISYYAVVTGLVVALASTFMACSFESPQGVDMHTPEGINAILNMSPVRSLSEGGRWTVYEAPGKISVQHGYGCLQEDHAVRKDYIGFRIQDTATVPRDMGDTGTIILNGWDAQYTNGDHHVTGLGAVIFNITEERTAEQYTLHWDAGGVLSDKNGDDGYRWCYRYTLAFWKRNASAFDTVPLQSPDVPLTLVDQYSDGVLYFLDGTSTNGVYGGPRAVLPRGFALSWEDTDHHVLQVAFDLGDPDFSRNTLSWSSQTILQDNSGKHGYNAAALVTVLSGLNAEMRQPSTVLHLQDTSWVEEPAQLILTPAKPTGCGGSGLREEYLESYAVANLPFDYAIPVLTGWDLSYVCTDHHVERVGVYLVEFNYEKDPNADTGTLYYTIFSTLRDDSDNGHAAQYQVSILGLNAGQLR